MTGVEVLEKQSAVFDHCHHDHDDVLQSRGAHDDSIKQHNQGQDMIQSTKNHRVTCIFSSGHAVEEELESVTCEAAWH
ncbi:Uncharacterized protein HZ326_12147 [Fusarium oxysporum f. sp. albedinis]|nr:Uncharacterized protein HZ326_12147 [Fusarium oxysporum f. sp. albedinis]